MRALRSLAFAALLATGAVSPGQEAATETSFATPAEPLIQATIYPARLAKSSLFKEIGEALLEDEFDGELTEMVEAYQEIVGVDLSTDVEKFRVAAWPDVATLVDAMPSWFELATTVADVEVQLKTSGNLTGILLAVPGYDGYTEHRGGMLHRMRLISDGGPTLRLWHTSTDGGTHAFASFNEDRLEAMLASDSDDEAPSTTLAKIVFTDPDATVAKRLLPKLLQGKPDSLEPTIESMISAAAARSLALVTRAELLVGGEHDGFGGLLAIESEDEFKAEQLRSLLAAGVGALKALDREADSEAHALLKLAEQIEVRSEDRYVRVFFRGDDVGAILKVLQDL